ncbi:MAG: sigma-E processing peptidase SpoIIGA [Oscillospiraceae bacterium]|nr:sigma-E processing peptidase SpoIIGA [Oscillospiraceae bacterium]
MRVIYIDILLLLNFYVTYFLIVGACCILHRKISASRRILGSIAGMLSSLMIFLPALPLILNIALKIAVSLIITFASLGFGNIRTFIKSSAVFIIINCIYAGIMLALWLFCAPMGMIYNNGVSYLDIPFWAVILSTSISYVILLIIRRVLDSKSDLDKKYQIEIVTSIGKVTLTAMPDSGNKLTDFLTGLPVIFCDIKCCSDICPQDIFTYLDDMNEKSASLRGIRLIPCSTVSGDTLAVCFKPNKLIIIDGQNKKEVNALIGFTKNGIKNEFGAIFNPNLL